MATMYLVEYDESTFYGTWRVSKFEAIEEAGASARSTDGEIVGTELTLEKGYDVRWKIPSNAEMIPLFSCESYEVVLTQPALITFISSSVGRVGPFAAEFSSQTRLEMTFDKAFILYCEKIPQSEQIQEAPFCYLPALEKGYFSDLVITSSSGKNYYVHKIILKLGCPDYAWGTGSSSSKQASRSYQACVLDGLPDSVISVILHFIYSESLPPGLSENAARECANAIMKIDGLEKLRKVCHSYLENYAVRTQIEHLCDDLENCWRKINSHIRMKPENSPVHSEAAAFWHGCKYAAREFAIAILKVMHICKLFSDNRNKLSREERHRIMRRCRDRLPRLFMLLSEFLEIVLSELTKQSSEARNELASCFLTEAEPLFDEAAKIFSELKKALEAIIDKDVIVKRRPRESILARTLKNAVHMKELAKLRTMHSETVDFINNLMVKRQHFALLTPEDKVRAISSVIEFAFDEIPILLDRISNWHGSLDMRLTWTQWKYFFKMGAAKVAWVIEKSKYSRSSIANALGAVRRLVKREDFDASLLSLGLIDGTNSPSTTVKKDVGKVTQDVESLCVSPAARDSVLSSRADDIFLNLEQQDNFADTKFIVHFNGNEGEAKTKTILAHRVIVSCRCDWFRRAFLSGMKEDIKREIDIHDCDPDVFIQFLRYLYTGRLDCSGVSLDTLADLIAVSDQYEVDALKSVCEGALKPQISNENVLELLSIGEQFNVASLRECCMEHIIHRPELQESEDFKNLSEKLQVEVKDLTEQLNAKQQAQRMPFISSGRLRIQLGAPEGIHVLDPTSFPENSADLTSEMAIIDQLTNALNLRHGDDGDGNSSDEDRECARELENCCEELACHSWI